MGSSIFGDVGGLAGVIGDYNSIRNGSYGKLMRKYYGSTVSGPSSSSGPAKTNNVLDRILEERRNPTISAEASKANQDLTNSIGGLKSSLSSLQKKDTFEDTQNGSTGREKTETALKKFVSSYNDTLAASKKTTMSNVSSNVAGIVKATEKDLDALKEIGITANKDGTLTFDQKKFETADLSKVKDLFSGDDALSYGSAVASRLNRASYYTEHVTTAAASTPQAVETKSNSTSLLSSIDNLTADKLFETTTGDDGKTKYNVDGISDEAKNFIKFYNATLSAAKNSGVSGVTSNLSSMITKTANHSGSLSSIGITVGADGKLSMNSDTFSATDMGKVQDTFSKYLTDIKTNASLLNYYSSTGNSASSSYSASGTYTSASDIVSSLYNTTT